MTFAQAEFDIRCEWGAHGVAQLAPVSDVVVIVDVLSFSTAVEIAVSGGVTVFPYRWRDETALAFARSLGAELAGPRGSRYSLSPAALLDAPAGLRLVLPSPNGATLSLLAGATPVLLGCLRNCRAAAAAASRYGARIAVIPAGERWPMPPSEADVLRPAWEDFAGAGAIIAHLAGALSPEAQAALAVWRDAAHEVTQRLRQCSSGKELIARGCAEDVTLAAQTDVSDAVPVLMGGTGFSRFT